MIVEALEQLGVEVVSVGDREIKALCPVHHLVKGRPDTKPSWYMNAETGAWLCFSCGQRGGLPHLIDLLDGDPDTLGRIPIEMMKAKAAKWGAEDTGPEIKERVKVDIESFDASPRPPTPVCDRRDIDIAAVERFNLRWDSKGKCWLIPIFAFDGQMLGWQEKSKGYFNNVPKSMEKSDALFGYHQVRGDTTCLVESPLDVARMDSYGVPAVASFGSFVSESQVHALVRRFKNVVLALDNDQAGMQCSIITAKMINDLGVGTVVKFFHYGDAKGKDPGELTPTELLRGYEQSSSFMTREMRNAISNRADSSRDSRVGHERGVRRAGAGPDSSRRPRSVRRRSIW